MELLLHLRALIVVLALVASPAIAGPGDADGDGVPDILDNCLIVPNAPPLDCDTDMDGFGNLCDHDLNNDSLCNGDLSLWFPQWQIDTDTSGADSDCNGRVNSHDLDLFLQLWGSCILGPSGLPCAGTVPCP